MWWVTQYFLNFLGKRGYRQSLSIKYLNYHKKLILKVAVDVSEKSWGNVKIDAHKYTFADYGQNLCPVLY
jgi:hypothetical protein